MAKIKVQAQHLQPGDIVGSGEIIHCISSGVSTPKGKVEVYLRAAISPNGWDRMASWGKYTQITVERAE